MARRRAANVRPAKSGIGFIGAIMWVVGVLVSLAVGFGMADGILTVRYVPLIITQIAGWIVVIGTVVGIILAIIRAAK